MKYCPKCQANVEGLLYWCDCCGEELEHKKQFFLCSIYELPQCLGFSALTQEMIAAIQPATPEKYESYVKEIGIQMVCYPEAILADGNIKNRLFYSQKKKYASITITVNFNDFISADIQGKGNLIAKALLQGVRLLQKRLQKNKLHIDDIVLHAETALGKYIV